MDHQHHKVDPVAAKSARHGTTTATTASSGMTDPVCGMSVASNSPLHVSYHGQTYYFCSARCKEKFTATPETYLKPKDVTPAPAGTTYTAPATTGNRFFRIRR